MATTAGEAVSEPSAEDAALFAVAMAEVAALRGTINAIFAVEKRKNKHLDSTNNIFLYFYAIKFDCIFLVRGFLLGRETTMPESQNPRPGDSRIQEMPLTMYIPG